ncbi:unnamed protein product, partial [Mesorhabditis spiculigera]
MMKQLFVLAACVAVAASTVIDCMSCRLDSIQVDTFVTGKFTSPTHGAIEITKLGCQQSGSQSGQGPQ